MLERVDNRGVSDTELSELLARGQLIPVVRGTTYDVVRKVRPLLGSRNGLDTPEDTIAIKITELVNLLSSAALKVACVVREPRIAHRLALIETRRLSR